MILDAGVETTARNIDAVNNSATVIWNGTVGMAEWEPTWSYGTFSLAHAIADATRAGKLESIVGGGDTVAALEASHTKSDMTYVSTGGGAFLESRPAAGGAFLMLHKNAQCGIIRGVGHDLAMPNSMGRLSCA